MKYFVKTFGCQYNVWEATELDYRLRSLGLESASASEADVVFVLSCSIRQTGVDRIFGFLRNHKGQKLVLAGCVLPNDKKQFLDRHPHLIVSDLKDLSTVLKEPGAKLSPNGLARNARGSVYLPIMTGCNNFCSYCVVPYVRGREQSKPAEKVVAEFKELVAAGVKEIILLGQNVNSYTISRKLKTESINPEKVNSDFSELLHTLNDIPGDFLISFTSNHPKDMSDDIILAVHDLPKVKKEIHLPLQSGSDKILKAMNRPYTSAMYLALAKKIKKMIPEIRLTTDTIVGFPGETENDFQKTADILREINFAQSFNNKFSPRQGTAAYKLGDPISWEEKERRWRILNEITNKRP